MYLNIRHAYLAWGRFIPSRAKAGEIEQSPVFAFKALRRLPFVAICLMVPGKSLSAGDQAINDPK